VGQSKQYVLKVVSKNTIALSNLFIELPRAPIMFYLAVGA
jgi:hypothetical protein